MSGATAGWEPPGEAATALIRELAQRTLEDTGPLFEVVDGAVLNAAPDRVLEEPALAGAFQEANHANMTHWLASNVAAPGARVPPNLEPNVLELARDIVRRGFDDTSLNSYRVGQNAALRFLMGQVFEITRDVDVIQELLDATSRSIFAFVDDTLAGIEAQIGFEREQLERGTHAERLAAVNLILEDAPISEQRAAMRLGYELAARHRAAVVWTDGSAPAGALERAADALARAAGSQRPFSVAASARSLWVWVVPAADAGGPEPGELDDGVRVAIGSDASGMSGFRRSHFAALATQRLMERAREEVRIASYPEIEAVALASADERRAVDFARRTLGELAGADPLLRETLLAYVRSDFNTSETARRLYAHRNTVLNRLERARELLPAPTDARALELGLALEIERWLGLAVAGEAS